MNKIYLFAIATILATASLMAGTFTVASFAQITGAPSGDTGTTNNTGALSSNTTGGNTTTNNATTGGY